MMKLNTKRTVYVGLAFMSICAFWQVYDNLVPLILKETFDIGDSLIGVVMALDNILALFMLPLFGKLSDKTRTKIGSRMPYILVGTGVALACLLIMPIAEGIQNLPLFLIGLGLVLIAMATYRSPAVALMPDVTIKPLRSKGNAVINLMGAIGGAVMLVVMMTMPSAIAGEPYRPNYVPYFAFLGVLMAVCIALLFWKIKENICVEEAKEMSKELGIVDEQEQESNGGKMPKEVSRSFVFLLVSIALWFFGYNAVTSGFSRYASVELKGNFASILLVCTVAAIIAYIPVGEISSRIGRKKTILIGILMLGISFGSGVLFYEVTPMLYVFFAFAGFGWAFINVNSYPMVVELCKGSDTGKYTGFYYTVSMAAQIATPMLSGVLMEYIGYRTLFPYAAFFVFASFVTMLFVKHGDAKPSVSKSKLENFDVED